MFAFSSKVVRARINPSLVRCDYRAEMPDIPHKHLGACSNTLPNDAEHFIRCPACGAWIDTRDRAQVLEHECAAAPPVRRTGISVPQTRSG
jgi:hypothetical protein